MSYAPYPPSRKAFLIGCPDDQHDPYLPGVEVDLNRYKNFLCSDAGGAWEEHEIHVLWNPSWGTARLMLMGGSAYDYTIVTFSGHGCWNLERRATEVAFGDGSSVDLRSLRTGASRQLVISDSCRQVAAREIEEGRVVIGGLGRIPEPEYRASCRAAYDKLFMDAGVGTSFALAASIGEAADETEGGGEFTRYLVALSDDWAEENARSARQVTRWLGIDKAVTHTGTRMQQAGLPQRPVYWGGRRIAHFPFAVA